MSAERPLNMRDLEGRIVAGRFRLCKYLDEGGFGAVYAASHVAYEVELRPVAVKLGKRPTTASEARRTFGDALMMARVAGSAPDEELRSHFVTVYDAGLCDDKGLEGHPYVVMEFVAGGSLKRCLGPGPLPLTRAMDYFDQILDAMAFMHGGVTHADGRPYPIIHRDLKTPNVLVSRCPDGRDVLKVTDFGLAIEVDTLLGWAENAGDLSCLAPECFSHGISSPQSDVYSLALMFYEMLTGRNPFADVGAHLLGPDEDRIEEQRRLHFEARRAERFALLERHPEMAQRPGLAQVIRKALSFDMTSREYADAGAFRDAWRRAKSGQARTGIGEQAWERVRRLVGEAKQCGAAGNTAEEDRLIGEAMDLNRDAARVPDSLMDAEAYLLAVRRRVRGGSAADLEEAGRVANEGYRRRKCHETCLAMAEYYRAKGSPLAAGFLREAQAGTGRGGRT